MASPPDAESLTRLVELVAGLVREKEETRELIARFGRGEITSEQIVSELSAQYQLGIGGAVRALAEHDPETAKLLGERLRLRLDGVLADLSQLASAPRATQPAATAPSQFKDRDDDVLKREYVILKLLANRNEEVRTGSILEATHAYDATVTEVALTAHLGRLVKAGVIARERKGRYRGSPAIGAQLAALANEIESRQLTLPKVTIGRSE